MYTILFFLSLFKISTCSLIIIWGEPSEWGNCSLTIAMDWESCIQQCEALDIWVFAYFDIFNECYLCGFRQILSIKDNRDSETTKVAFKANTSSCDRLSTYYSTSEYFVTHNNGFWNFTWTVDNEENTMTTTIPPIFYWGFKCPDGWYYTVRSMGMWCIRVYDGTMNRADALSFCEKQGGVLSGVENEAELKFIIYIGKKVARSIVMNAPGSGALWIGAERIVACSGSAENSVGCVPWPNNAYHWTDRFTTLKNMMTWLPGQPDYADENENCVQMAIVNTTDVSSGTFSGGLSDCTCDMTTSTKMVNSIIGFVCGQHEICTTSYC